MPYFPSFHQVSLAGLLCASTLPLWATDTSSNAAPVAPAAPMRQLPLVTTVSDAAALPVTIVATDPQVHYLGRFDTSKGDPRCSWTASTVLLKFQGTDLNAQMEDSGTSYWEIEIDGKPVQKMALGTGSHLYQIASGLPSGPHTARLVRASEASLGPTQIHGFQLNQGGALLPVTVPDHRLEVIGDSITCGAANEGIPGKKSAQNVEENGYLSYPAFAARQLGLDYRCVSWSGRKMWPKNTVPEIYDLTIPTEKDSKWDFSQWVPDAIVINLSTNDFNRGPVDEAAWTGAYEKFVTLLHSHFPKAEIYCTTSPMLMGDRLTVSKTYLAKVVSDLNASGDTKSHYFEFASEDPTDGVGGARHPNVKTDQIMGDMLAAQLSKDLGWASAAP
jgi:hypothetical protein